MTEAKNNTKQTLAQKRASSVAKRAKKSAAKVQVRETRTVQRAIKAREAANAERGTKASRWKVKAPGAAPQAARISPVKGPMVPEAAKTHFAPRATRGDDQRNWLVVDATNQVVGRLATQIAELLRGKHKPTYTPNNDVGDFVVVLNADKVRFTSNKEEDKRYYRHTGYVGGLKEISPAGLRERAPERIIEFAVKGMVPRNPLGRAQMKKLKVYAGESHPHAAQNPVAWELRHNTAR